MFKLRHVVEYQQANARKQTFAYVYACILSFVNTTTNEITMMIKKKTKKKGKKEKFNKMFNISPAKYLLPENIQQ